MTASPDEHERLRMLWSMLDRVAPLVARTTTDRWDGWSVHPKSPMAGDDVKLDPYQLSHAVRLALLVAVDHFQALKASLTGPASKKHQQMTIHTYAQFTLLRAALENAARAVWLLSPTARPERVRRTLVLHFDDLKNGERLAKAVGESQETATEVECRRDRIRGLLVAADAVPRDVPPEAMTKAANNALRFLGYEDVVRDAGEATDELDARVFWKICSSLAHGDLSGTRAVLDRELARTGGKVATFKLTGSVKALFVITSTALRMTYKAFDLYKLRAAAPY